MKKIPSLFIRDWEGDRSRVTREVNPECQWVIDGEGVATRKWDGTCVMIRDGIAYKRYTLRPGREAPEGFEPASEKDPNTEKVEGWLPVSPDDKYHIEALRLEETATQEGLKDGTYELLGPKIQGNSERFSCHVLNPHGKLLYSDCPRTYDGLVEWLSGKDIEGVVWHHSGGRMAKIKLKDLGLERGCTTPS